jgi:glycosyltransferase involved in cell wall biosynthesis
MKVALVSFLYEVELGGGAAAAVNMLAEGLLECGHQVLIITTHAHPQPIVEQPAAGLTIWRFFPRNFYWVGQKDLQPTWKKVLWQLLDIWNPFTFQTMRHILSQEQPDLVHVHKLRGLSPAVWSAAHQVGINPIIQTCHDYELMSPEGTLAGRVGTWAEQGSWFVRPYQTIRARLAQKLTAITVPSQYLLQMLQRRGFFQSTSQFVVPNSHGLTASQLAQSQAKLKSQAHPKKTRLLYLGRLEAIKGVELLCQAFTQWAARFPHLQLDVAGWGSLSQTLQQQYGHHPQITWHGPVFGQAKGLLLESADVLIAPSVGPEAFGIVIVEAFAHGLPVIATTSGAIPEVIENGKTGLLVPPGDVEALGEAIARVAQYPDTLYQMAPACLAAAQQYSMEAITQRYLAIYKAFSGATVAPI